MKMATLPETEILAAYKSYWDFYLQGDLEGMTRLLADEYTQVGSAEHELFSSKNEAVSFWQKTIDQVAGKSKIIHHNMQVRPLGVLALVQGIFEINVLAGVEWVYYGSLRASAILIKVNGGWKILHQHSSFPDVKTGNGEYIAIDKVAEENNQLRQAVQLRTAELEQINRELEIEAALERIRASAMAMQSSNELYNVVNVLREQMGRLGQPQLEIAAVHLYTDGSDTFESWYASRVGEDATGCIITGSTLFRKDSCELVTEMMVAYETNKKDYTLEASGEKLMEWLNVLKNAAPSLTNEVDHSMNRLYTNNAGRWDKQPVAYYHFSNFSGGSLVMVSFEPPTEEAKNLHHRAAAVFDLAYRRYTDIKLAEAQAKEFKIENGLEKVRSRSLEMRSSNELQEVVKVVFENLRSLGIKNIDALNINIFKDGSKDFDLWLAAPGQNYTSNFHIPYIDHPIPNDFFETINQGNNLHVRVYDYGTKNAYFNYMFQHSDNRNLPEDRKQLILNGKAYAVSAAISAHSAIFVNNYSGEVLNDEDNKILLRFSRVFDQAYTRYLDLKKAEEQTREAQIEAALERVRSRTIAMQKSTELRDVIQIVYDQLRQLDFKIDSAHFNLNYKDGDDYNLWTAAPGQPYPVKTYIPYFDHPVFFTARHAKQKGLEFFTENYSKEEKNVFFEHLFSHAPLIPEERRKYILAGQGVAASTVVLNNISLWIMNYAGIPYTEAENEILKRFGKIFEQSHTRFLDLQKAEAQAREAQIELALERVRARAMAMQNSNELADLVEAVFKELTKLHVLLDRCLIMIYDPKTNDSTWWLANPEPEKAPVGYFVKYHEHKPYTEYINAWKARTVKWEYLLEGDNKKQWDEFIFAETELSHLPAPVIAGMKSFDRIFLNVSFNNFGSLTVSSVEPIKGEQFDILLRFAKVFDTTYTRFNDLKQAEAQARESQIQLALERVRARTMAMQKSNELAEAAELLYHEFGKLSIDTFTCGYLFIKENENIQIAWVVLPNGKLLPDQIEFPLTGDRVMDDRYQAWKEKKPLHILELKGEENKKHHKFLSRYVPQFVVEDIFSHVPERIIFYCANFSNGYLFIIATDFLSSADELTIIRFAKVFEQTYTRFLDLQKAEAQAREAQIDLGLERVRASAMAMHSTKGFLEVTKVLREQVALLGEKELESIIIHIYNEEEDSVEAWYSYRNPRDVDGNVTDGRNKASWSGMARTASDKQKYYSDESDYTIVADRAMLTEWYEYLHKTIPEVVDLDNEGNIIVPDVLYYNYSKFAGGALLLITNSEASTNSKSLLKRSAKVFSLAYTRFLDLQKAEGQAREAQIEVALERVRSRTMAMYKSKEVMDVAVTVYDELQKLEFKFGAATIIIMDRETGYMQHWLAGFFQNNHVESYEVNNYQHPIHAAQLSAWKKGEKFVSIELEGAELKAYAEEMFTQTGYKNLPDEEKIMLAANEHAVFNMAYMSHGALMWAPSALSGEKIIILQRFAKVFEQTYTRFLDLQKAEAQAREAEIQLGLERVRARTMAMQKSDELQVMAREVLEQLKYLGLSNSNSNFSFCIFNEATDIITIWRASEQNEEIPKGEMLSAKGLPSIRNAYEVWKATPPELRKKLFFVHDFYGQALEEYYSFFETQPDFREATVFLRQMNLNRIIHHSACFSQGELNFTLSNSEPLNDEELKILQRFAAVFEQSYVRFLELQKAEAQAREATIETALEKVRSMAMAMHNSEDVNATIAVFYRELGSLGLKPRGCGVGLMHKDERVAEISTMNATETGEAVAVSGNIKMEGHPLLEGIYDSWLHQKEYHTVLRGNAIKDYYKILKNQIAFPSYHGDVVQYGYFFTFKEGGVYAWTDKELKEDELSIYRRFASVLSLTYRRYKDLKEAEKQAREATVEAALERVRAKAMSMHSSKDLADTIGVFYHEMGLLKITPRRCGVGLLDKQSKMAELSTMNTTSPGKSIEIVGSLKLEGHPVLEGIYANWLMQQEYHPVLRGNEIKKYYQLIRPQIQFPDYPDDEVQYGYFFFFPNGGVYAWTEKELQEDEIKIYRKFTSVLSLTYKRYKELKEAEEGTRLAVKQSSLDRIRAEIASMRTTDDLQRITPSVWKELITLGVPFFRCGVFIVNEQEGKMHSYLSTPDGKPLGVLHLDFNSSATTTNVVQSWRDQKVYREHWSREEFLAWVDSMIGQGQSITATTYQGNTPPDSLTLQFVPFTQGMIYVGSADVLNDQQIELVQALAEAFSTAYARYEDFNKLDLAKQQVDNTLRELKAAQQLLVQSEKMASLGELTAGIAHEIQNPLNFINNFSEVNNELIEELEQAVKKGNIEEVKTLAADLRFNEQKINHHGKRADAIVKGMLQHSRTNTGQKEVININALAEEYLQLSYHGCRAKDKNCSTVAETHFDETLPKVAVVPQELGRVFLNIFNNAFYSVSERKKQVVTGYQPRVVVSTKRVDNKVKITITDNGTGIPKKVYDKIFQPFFTTKPSGQGTGLGLSLSYDIIKAHGGEIQVETKEGEGSEFMIVLPAT